MTVGCGDGLVRCVGGERKEDEGWGRSEKEGRTENIKRETREKGRY